MIRDNMSGLLSVWEALQGLTSLVMLETSSWRVAGWKRHGVGLSRAGQNSWFPLHSSTNRLMNVCVWMYCSLIIMQHKLQDCWKLHLAWIRKFLEHIQMRLLAETVQSLKSGPVHAVLIPEVSCDLIQMDPLFAVGDGSQKATCCYWFFCCWVLWPCWFPQVLQIRTI